MVTSHPGGRGAFIAVGSESQISVDQVTLYSSNQRNTQISGYFFWGGEHAQKPKFGDGFSVVLDTSSCRSKVFTKHFKVYISLMGFLHI